MVFYDDKYWWIQTQRAGVVHNICDYIYLVIDIVLSAHKEEYPHNPAELGKFNFNL